MKRVVMATATLGLACMMGAAAAQTTAPSGIATDAAQVRAAMQRAFAWQVAHPTTEKAPIGGLNGARGWVRGAMMVGVMEAYRATQDPAYVNYAWKWAEACGWEVAEPWDHPDNHAACQTYLELHGIDPQRARIGPTVAAFDRLLAEKRAGAQHFWWCDALFMEPPAWGRLAKVTGDRKYMAEMARLYWESVAFLYDREERLFFRDKNYMPHAEGFQPVRVTTRPATRGSTRALTQSRRFLEANGNKMFWSRGNGWVLAGLARLLDGMPKDAPERAQLEALFKELAERVLELQGADGLWRMGLLDQAAYGHGEVSGSGFFVYAFAWGVRSGLLEGDKYLPAVQKGWGGLQGCQVAGGEADGKVGWVQPIGAAPGALRAELNQEYGTGAFLMAGAEILRLVEGRTTP